MLLSNQRRLSRRRLVSIAAGGAAALALGPASHDVAAQDASTPQPNLLLPVPYLHQGGTGTNEGVNCGPATVAMAVNYSQVAFPSVADVRATLGMDGPTDIDQWAGLLSAYGVPWYSTWSQWDMDEALKKGHALVIAAWMGDFTPAADFETAYAQNWSWSGRYDGFDKGHAMLIAGSADGGTNYLVHDPNVFPGSGTSFYGDGTPKGAYRRYSWWELWGTVGRYASGQALAIVPPAPVADPNAVKRVRPENAVIYDGPGGGRSARRGVTSPITTTSER